MIRSRSGKNSDMWFLKFQIFQQRYKLKLEFPDGWGGVKQKILNREIWIFSRVTQ